MVEEEPLLAMDPEAVGPSTAVVPVVAMEEEAAGGPQQEMEAVAGAGAAIVEIPSSEGSVDEEEAFILQRRPSPGEIVTS